MSSTQAASRLRQHLAQDLREHFDLGKALIAARGPLVRGWLHVRYTSCRKGRCKCTRNEKHGPFLYASLHLGPKILQTYVGKPEDQALVRHLQNYKDFRNKLGRWRKLHAQIETAWKRFEKSLLIVPRK